MKNEKPIIFSAEMVKAILDGRKTVTRRVMIPQPVLVTAGSGREKLCIWVNSGGCWYCPIEYAVQNKLARYQVGDLLWVKETYCHGIEWDDCKPSEVDPLCGGNDIWYFADGERPTEGWGKKRSSRFMPKWVARIFLEVVSVRAERLQVVSWADIRQEGVDCPDFSLRKAFKELWDKLSHKRGYGWVTNPWVWRIEFKIIKPRRAGIVNNNGIKSLETPRLKNAPK